MKQKLLVLIVTLVLFGGFVWANSASAWTATIRAEGQYLGGVYQNSVKIGVASQAQTTPALLTSPPKYSVKMDLYTPDLTTLFRKDIRQEGQMRYTWVFGIDPYGNIQPPFDDTRTATLIWNPLDFGPGTYELREGFDGTGPIVVADMTTTTSYLVEGAQGIQYFTLTFTEADSDEDGVPDRIDNCPNDSNPDQKDSDGDTFGDACDGCPDDPNKIDDSDFDEDGTPDCADMDDDNDRIPDGWEIDNGLNPLFDDADEDPDGDGFSNLREYVADTNPQNADDFPSVVPAVENFETGDLSQLPWVTTGANVWSVTTTTNHTPDGNYVYVTNQGENTVTVIQPFNYTVTSTVNVGQTPGGLDVTPNGTFVYVANQGQDSVSVIDTTTNTVIDTINVGDAPFGVVVDPTSGNYVYVTNKNENTVSVIHTSNNTVTSTINVGTSPGGLDITPDKNYVYVANQGEDSVSVIDTTTNTVIDTINVGNGPFGVVVDPDGNYVYVTNQLEDTVSVIRTSDNTTVLPNIPVGASPTGLDVTPNGSSVYVANQWQDSVSVIDTATNNVIDTINVGNSPFGVVVNPDGNYAYVANRYDNTVSVIDITNNNISDTINVGDTPFGVAVTPGGVYTYAAEAPSLADKESASLKVRMYCEEGNISFWYAVSSEQDYDFLYFYIDGIEHGAWSGEVPYTEATFAITSGMHTFQWVYAKDKSYISGADTAWVDDISFPKGIDSDFDGIPDGWEIDNGLNPLFDDADEDPDGDGFSNLREYVAGTNPQDPDDFLPVTTVDLSLPSGWSMISLPVAPDNTSLSNLFPGAVVVYGYEKGAGYVRIRNNEKLAAGRGYWILLDEEKIYTLTGQPFHSHTKTVSEDGWDMIGGCTDPAQVILNGCDSRVIYGYTQGFGYQRVLESESLTPGQGYWILFDDVMDQAEMRVEVMTQSGK